MKGQAFSIYNYETVDFFFQSWLILADKILLLEITINSWAKSETRECLGTTRWKKMVNR